MDKSAEHLSIPVDFLWNVTCFQKLGGSGDLSQEAIKRCAEELHVDEESGELRQEVLVALALDIV